MLSRFGLNQTNNNAWTGGVPGQPRRSSLQLYAPRFSTEPDAHMGGMRAKSLSLDLSSGSVSSARSAARVVVTRPADAAPKHAPKLDLTGTWIKVGSDREPLVVDAIVATPVCSCHTASATPCSRKHALLPGPMLCALRASFINTLVMPLLRRHLPRNHHAHRHP